MSVSLIDGHIDNDVQEFTFEDVKRIRENPTAECCDIKELHELIDTAIEKQIPKKPLWGGTNNASWRSCPECHSRENKTHKYCSQCGQKLLWEGAEK